MMWSKRKELGVWASQAIIESWKFLQNLPGIVMNKSDISALHQMPWFQLGHLEDLQEGFRFRLVFEAPSSVFVCRKLVSVYFPDTGFAEEDRLHSEQTERSWFSDGLPSRLPPFQRTLREFQEHETAGYIWILVQDFSWRFDEWFESG